MIGKTHCKHTHTGFVIVIFEIQFNESFKLTLNSIFYGTAKREFEYFFKVFLLEAKAKLA